MLGRQHLSNRTFDFFRYVHRIVATVRKKFQIYEKKKKQSVSSDSCSVLRTSMSRMRCRNE